MRELLAKGLLWAFATTLVGLAMCTGRVTAAPVVVHLNPTVIERKTVVSTSIASVGYQAKEHTLEIEFRAGMVYRYFEVPPSIFKAFLRAESKGRYFSQHIRGRFAFSRVGAPAQ